MRNIKKRSSARMAQITTGLAVAGLAVVGLGACTSTSYSCSNNECTVTLSGSGAETEVGTNEVPIVLDGADGTTATFSVAGETAECAAGDSLTVAGYSVTCDTVGDDELELTIL